jgi:L-lysine 6-transaminase
MPPPAAARLRHLPATTLNQDPAAAARSLVMTTQIGPVAPITPANVHETLARTMIADGFEVVLDLERSHGVRLYDARTRRTYLDMFSCFASAPLGFNHPRLTEPEFVARLGRIAVNKPSNSDLFTVEMAEFVDTFRRLAQPAELPHLFVIEGGALGVENAMKAAMDWKVRKNLARGRGEQGHQVIHFRECFHGRTGYSISCTNTDPVKSMYFAKLDWPRIPNPKLSFPVTADVQARVAAVERQAVDEIERAFARNGDDICAIILEPIQGEGGDNHFRPEFVRELRRLADENDAFLILDEVQTGLGMTGKMWAYEHFGIVPDAIAFGKKMQMGGTCVGRRVDEVQDNVFRVPSRINSTWGGNLVDMVRCTRILEVIAAEGLVENAARVGAHLLAGLQKLCEKHPQWLSNPRGRGLFCAADAPDKSTRGEMFKGCFERGLMLIGSGERSLRFRPALTVTAAEIDAALDILDATLAARR